MTLQEAKDTIARRHNQPDWDRLMSNTHSINKIDRIMDKAAELYARSKWEECYEVTKETTFAIGLKGVSPQPEFKP